MGRWVLPEEDGHGGGLAEEGDVEALVEPPQSLALVDRVESILDAIVLGHKVICGLSIVA